MRALIKQCTQISGVSGIEDWSSGVASHLSQGCIGLLQVYASYRYRRDLADAAKISGVFGRSRILKREEAIKQKVSMHAITLLCPLHPAFLQQASHQLLA